MRWSPPIELTPEEAKICEKHVKHRRFFRFARLHRHELFDEATQAALDTLYSDSPRGTPPKPPAMLAMAVLLQAAMGISDAELIDVLENDRRYQMVLDCLGTERAPFKETTFVEFRQRLILGGADKLLLRRTVELAKGSKDFGPRQAAALRVALDSEPLEGAGRVEDTLNLLGHALRLLVTVVATCFGLEQHQVIAEAGLKLVGVSSLKAALDLEWESPDAQQLAVRKVTAELDRFERYWRGKMAAGTSLLAVEEMQKRADLVREQNLERGADGQEQPREGVIPDRLISLSDPDMRHGRKSDTERIDGFKKYLASDLDDELVLAAGVLPANVAEPKGADKLKPEVERYGRVSELAIDRAFLSSNFAIEVNQSGGQVVCRAFHAKNGELYCKSDFEIDLVARTVKCPAGKLAVIKSADVHFSKNACYNCPQRSQCQQPGAKQGRKIKISPQEALLQKLAQAEKTPEGRAKLRKRMSIEHKLAHHGRRQGKRARYFGVEKNDYDMNRVAAVQNLMEMARREAARAADTRARAEREPERRVALWRVVFWGEGL